MVSIGTLLRILESFKRNDTTAIDNEIRQIIALAEKRKNHKLAKDLRAIYALPYSGVSLEGGKFYASSLAPSQNNQRLFEIRKSDVNLSDLILSEKNLEVFDEIKEGFVNKDMLQKHGLFNDGRILLYGPPGTGKTLFAYVLAGELGIPIIHVYLDALISSYLGETGKNLGNIFREAQSRSCILFLDEFDAVAKQRDDSQELGELKRVVTVLLQNIDALSPSTILIAATNHQHLLDPAIWRRFDYQLNLDYLDKQSRIKLIKLYLGERESLELNLMAELSENLSGATIKQAINKALRKHLLRKPEEDFSAVILQEFAVLLSSSKDSFKKNRTNFIKAIRILREIDSKRYTFDYLEKLTGVPSSTLHNILITV